MDGPPAGGVGDHPPPRRPRRRRVAPCLGPGRHGARARGRRRRSLGDAARLTDKLRAGESLPPRWASIAASTSTRLPSRGVTRSAPISKRAPRRTSASRRGPHARRIGPARLLVPDWRSPVSLAIGAVFARRARLGIRDVPGRRRVKQSDPGGASTARPGRTRRLHRIGEAPEVAPARTARRQRPPPADPTPSDDDHDATDHDDHDATDHDHHDAGSIGIRWRVRRRGHPQGARAATGSARSTTSSPARRSTEANGTSSRPRTSGYVEGDDCYVDSPNNVSVSNGLLDLTVRSESAPFELRSGTTPRSTRAAWSRPTGCSTRHTAGSRFGPSSRPSRSRGSRRRSGCGRRTPRSTARGRHRARSTSPSSTASTRTSTSPTSTTTRRPTTPTSPPTTATSETGPSSTPTPWSGRRRRSRSSTTGPPASSTTGTQRGPVAPQPFDQRFFVVLTQGLGSGSNAVDPSTTRLPATTQIDYVRVWK